MLVANPVPKVSQTTRTSGTGHLGAHEREPRITLGLEP
jgi:hypothetical protein